MKNSMNKIRPGLLLMALLTLSLWGTILCQAATIYVSSYGGYPDDSTDDTSAINSAITAAGSGDTVSFSAGTYDLITPYDSTTHIRIYEKDNLTLQGRHPAANLQLPCFAITQILTVSLPSLTWSTTRTTVI